MMKIGFDAKRLFHNDTGLGNYSRTLVRNLVQFYPENEYHLFTPSVKEGPAFDFFLDTNRFHIHTCQGGVKAVWRSIGIPKLLDEKQIDIYHGLSHELPLKRPKGNTRYIVSFHDMIYEVYPHLFPFFDRKMYQLKYKRSAQSADKIISISHSTARDLKKWYKISSEKISTVYQSCHSAFLNASVPDSKEDYFLYVGSIIPRKGLLEIARAYAKLPEAYRLPIKIVGGGQKYRREVQAFVQEQQLSSYFDFLGKIENHQLIDLYRHAKALILPSMYEGFGIPIIEALSQATPCITSNISSLPEAAGPGGILIDPKNPDAIGKAMMTLIDFPEKGRALGKKGQAYVQQTFNAEITTRQLHDVYREVLKQ